MFSTPAERFDYEYALSKHDDLMDEESSQARAYRFGYYGYSENPLLNYEYWRAGRENAKRHKSEGE